MDKGLTLEAVSIRQGDDLLISLDALIPPGEVLTVMGPSGSGKSTLLSFVIGALSPDFEASGRVLVDGKDLTRLPPNRRNMGILFQEALLFPHLTVGQNLAFGLPRTVRGADRAKAIETALADIDLAGFADRDPATLSGGQKSRVALMRTLLSEPRALLLNEPFSRLDQELRGQIRQFVFDRAKDRGLPVLLVTHDREDATGHIHTVV